MGNFQRKHRAACIPTTLMTIRILLISDIHGNYPALKAVDQQLTAASFDYIINAGDSLVYAPFPNEILAWLAEHHAIPILGNTDIKTIKFFSGKSVKKPGNPENALCTPQRLVG